ncbi:MAG: hypothetical protein K9I34_05350 [Bacteroidales bacterium]|nr:hypothetical protein [Bacteroidales bacterium]
MKAQSINIGLRILAIMIILFIGNYLYTKTLWPKDVSKHADLIDSLNKYQFNSDILYLASSSNYFCPGDDTNKWMISEWIQKSLPNQRIHAIQKGYMHAGPYLNLIKNLDQATSVKTLIIEMNLRAFGAFWVFSNVETNYAIQELFMNPSIPPLGKRALLSLGAYDNKTDAQRKEQFLEWWRTHELTFPYPFEYKYVTDWDYGLANSGRYVKENGNWDYDQIGFACNIVKAFAFHIDTLTHPRIHDFDAIVKVAYQRDWRIIFVIVPEDIQKAERLVGKEIPYLLNQAADLLYKRYNSDKAQVINCLNMLPADCFYEAFPTEHYYSHGKKQVADTLLQVLKEY